MSNFRKQIYLPNTIFQIIFFDKSLLFGGINLQADHFSVFNTLFKAFREQVTLPDLIIYLHRPVESLLKNIKKRGRAFEQDIKAEYLEKLQEAYFTYFKTITDIPVALLDLKDLDFIEDKDLIEKIFDLSGQRFNFGLNLISF